jgi:hypothetical protein
VVAIGRASGGTPAKPGFRRSRKCAQMKSFLYPLVFYREKHYNPRNLRAVLTAHCSRYNGEYGDGGEFGGAV